MPDDTEEKKPKKGGMFAGISDKLKGLPTWSYFVIGGVGIFLAIKFNQSQSGTSNSGVSSGQSGIASSDANGYPYYFDTGQNSPYSGSSSGSSTGTSSGLPTPTPTPTPVPTPNPTSGPPLPAGTQVNFGAQGRSWYTVPGGTQQPLAGMPGALLHDPFDLITQGSNGAWYYQPGQNAQDAASKSKQLLVQSATGQGNGGATGYDMEWNTNARDTSLFAHMLDAGMYSEFLE